MSDTTLRTFPTNNIEALVMLFLQNQDLSMKSPAEICTMYFEAFKEIQRDIEKKNEAGYEFTI